MIGWYCVRIYGLLLPLLLVSLSLPNSGCSVWQSEGREFLEKQGLEFAAQHVQSFIQYKNEDCSPQPLFDPHQLSLTGIFEFRVEETIWTMKTYSSNEGLGFMKHLISLDSNEGQDILYCHPLSIPLAKTTLLIQDVLPLFFARPEDPRS
ncbi:MAG: hypothetical protein IPJ71_05250 [Bdellovibrionales bacterium]|nr:hypothetical protein [Bdellovibrionales bacterium]